MKLDIYKGFFILQKEKREKEKMSFVKRLIFGKIKKFKFFLDNEGVDKILYIRYFVLLLE